MINPNKKTFASGHITKITKCTSMTVIKVWIDGSELEYTSFNYKRRFKVNDNVRCRIGFSIISDGCYIDDMKRE